MNAKTIDMTKGNPIRLLLLFSIPMLIGNIFQQFYNLVDSVIVGRFIGANALAAVGATGSVSFLFFALCNGIGSGGGVLAAQKFGAGNTEQVKKTLFNTALVMLFSSLSVSLFAYLISAPLLRFLRTPDEIMSDALIYMHIQCLTVPFIATYNYASSMLRALGDSRTPLYFLIFSCFLNAGLDLLFVCVFQAGVFGAALATALAQFIAGGTCLGYAFLRNPYFRLKKEHLKVDKHIVWGVTRLGVPLSMQYSLIAISCMAMQTVVNSFGPAVVAAFTASSRIEQLIHQPYGSLSAAISTYAAQNLGAGQKDRIHIGLRKGIFLMGCFSLFTLPIMQLFGEELIHIFVADPEVIYYGGLALRITSVFYFALGLIYVIRGTMNGVGDAAFAFINGVVEMFGRITLPAALTMLPLFGIWGIWWAAALTWVMSAFFCILRYRSWKKKSAAPSSSVGIASV